jgi:hypothetical protein
MIELIVTRPQSTFTQVLSAYESRVPADGGTLEASCLSDALLELDNSGYVNQRVDLSGEFDLNITRSIADIREPQTRQGDWSKTIVIPGTKANNELFGHIFEIEQIITGSGQFAPTFNPNLKAECFVLLDGLEQLKGFLRVIQINITDTDLIEYECAIFGTTANFFSIIENAKLNELDFSEYNHTLNIANVEASWDTYIYQDGATATFEYGKGYMYPIIYPQSSLEILSDEDNFPALYAKTIVDKIFSEVGYTYTNDSFFESDRFKRLIVPWTNRGLEIDETTAANYLFKAAQTDPNTTYSLDDQLLFSTEISDPGNDYATGTSTYNVDQGGQHTFYHKFSGNVEYLGVGLPATMQIGVGVYVNGVRKSTLTHLNTNLIGSNFIFDTLDWVTISVKNGDAVTLKLDSVVGQELVGSVLQAVYLVDADFTFNSSSSSEFYNAFEAKAFAHNSSVDFTRFFGKEKQSELFMGFVNLFNLYIEETSTRELRIVPRDEFYNGANINWTAKLDYSQPYSVVPMGEVVGNPYYLTYKEGGDVANVEFQDRVGGTYGDRLIRIENDFIKEEKRVEVCFVPTQMYSQNGRYYSCIEYDNTNASELRLLYYSGLQNCSVYYTRNQGESLTQNARYSYPVTLHIDSVTDMQFDLSFGMPFDINVPAGFSYSNQNVGNVYWYRFLTEIADKNSKVFRGNFRISPKDWATLSFTDNFFFEGQYWRLLQVADYNPLIDGVFECEFLLAKYIQPVTATSKGVGTNATDTYDNRYPLGTRKPLQNGGVVIGGGNDTDEQVIVLGKDNDVNGERNAVIGSHGTYIAPGMNDVIALNCDDFTPKESNTTYYGNYKVWPTFTAAGKVVTIDNTDSPYSATAEDWMILADTTMASVSVVLPDPTGLMGRHFIIKKIASSNGVTLTAGDGSILIEGATSHTNNANNGWDWVVCDGTKYWLISEGH